MLLSLLSAIPYKVKGVLISAKTENVHGNGSNRPLISPKHFGKSAAGTCMSHSTVCINCFNSFPSCSVSCISNEWVLISSYYFKGHPVQTSSIPMA